MSNERAMSDRAEGRVRASRPPSASSSANGRTAERAAVHSRPSSSRPAPAASQQQGRGSDTLLSEQVARLKDQCAVLEQESSAADASLSDTIKQNRQLWMALKAENKQYKQQLAQRRNTALLSTAAEEQASRSVKQLEKRVHDLRRQYDRLMQDKKTAVAKLSHCQDSVLELHKAAGGVAHDSPDKAGGASCGASTAGSTISMGPAWDSKESRAVRQLENRLSKAQLKANEAQSIRRMYEQVLDRVRQEQLGFGPYVQSLEAALQAKQGDHSRLTQAVVEAQHAKEKAKQELASFLTKVMQQRAAREAVLQEQRAKADTLGAANRALLAQQFGHRDASLPAGLLPQQGSSAELQGLQTSGGEESRDALQGSSEGGESLSQGGVQGEGSAVGSSSVKIGAAEVVQQLREVAMAPSVHAMLDHMLPRQEAHDKLKASLASVQAEEARLAEEVKAAQTALQEIQEGRKSCNTQAHLDAAQAQLTAAVQKAEAAKEAHSKVMHAYVDVRAGLEHIATMLVQLPLPPGQLPVPFSEDTLGDVLAQSHERIAAAVNFIRTLPKAGALLDRLMQESDQSIVEEL